MHQGSCHCGAVRLTLPSTPDVAADCNCSLCRRIRGPWVYFEFGTVKIEGHPVAVYLSQNAAYIIPNRAWRGGDQRKDFVNYVKERMRRSVEG
jgi:hypothetical protein